MTPREALRRLAVLHESWVQVAEEQPEHPVAVALRQCADDLEPIVAALDADGTVGTLGAPPGVPSAYVAGLLVCTTLAELQAHVLSYGTLAQDAGVIVQAMTAEGWADFIDGLPAARGNGAPADWLRAYGSILVPEPMLTVAALADIFDVPFGVALSRLQDGQMLRLGRREVH